MSVKFTIVVVCYNAGEKLEKTISSILMQTYAEFEIIVKDGLSTDQSIEQIPEDGRIECYSQEDRGIYDAMNQAVTYGDGDYYLFLNCGDTFYKNSVLEEASQFIERMKIGSEGRNCKLFYGDTFCESTGNLVPMPSVMTPFTCYRNIPCHQSCFYKAELVKEKEYDLDFKIRADYDHFLWCYFKKEASPVHMGMCVSSYEGGGFSESKENIKRDKQEHKQITGMYFTKKQVIGYNVLLYGSLLPLRKLLAESKWFSGSYENLKKIVYRRKMKKNNLEK